MSSKFTFNHCGVCLNPDTDFEIKNSRYGAFLIKTAQYENRWACGYSGYVCNSHYVSCPVSKQMAEYPTKEAALLAVFKELITDRYSRENCKSFIKMLKLERLKVNAQLSLFS